MTEIATYSASTRIVFGPGAVSQVGELARQAGIGRALVVTDAGVVAAGLAAAVTGRLEDAGVDCVIYDDVEPNPSIETVDKALNAYRRGGCQGIIAVGGGSPMDAAKATAVLATNPGKATDYVGLDKILKPMAPLLAVPTTVGTGSEVTIWCVITDLAQRKKVVLGSPLLAPKVAVLDPEMVASMPASLVASTGIDALTHAIESLISTFATPFSDGPALEAIRLIALNLPAAVADVDLEARGNMLYASASAGLSFSYGRTGLVHGMAHPLSSYCDVPHGLANAILLPHVLEFNAKHCEPQLARASVAMGGPATAEGAIEAVRRLNASVGIPQRLSDVGVTEEHIKAMSRDAFASGNAQSVNPRQPTYEQVLALFQQAL